MTVMITAQQDSKARHSACASVCAFWLCPLPVRDDAVWTLLTMTKPSSTTSASSIDERPPDGEGGGRLPKLPRRPTARPATSEPHQLLMSILLHT